MSNTNTGGPAFPHTEANGENSVEVGMTLRDYFAAKAMSSLIEDPDLRSAHLDGAAIFAYKMADAMLKAREA
jgi:hypothetical protein